MHELLLRILETLLRIFETLLRMSTGFDMFFLFC